MTTLALLSTAPDQARDFRRNGWWRDTTFLDDLDHWAETRPDSLAFATSRTRPGLESLSYREFRLRVRRFARGLHDLGVRAGDVVAFQLPDWWETSVLLLAAMSAGAIAQPMVPELRAREIERALRRTSARVFVTVDTWTDHDHAAAIAEMAPRLPHLRHRVVHGDAARTGALDFTDVFGDPTIPTPTDDPRDVHRATGAGLDPDRPCLVLFTSGSTGESKGVLHSCNTLHAGTRGMTDRTTDPRDAATGGDRAAATLRMTHIAGPLWMIFGTLLSGGVAIAQDTFHPGGLLDLLRDAGATRFLTTPPKLTALVDVQRREPRELPSLHTICAGGTTVPPDLPPRVREVFGLPLRSVWGMTEVVVGTVVGRDAPLDWSSHSDGAPLPGLELRVATESGGADDRGGVGRLQVRGASLCLGSITSDISDVSPPTADDDGWFDTGDLARADGRGGFRIVGRVIDRVYDPEGSVMIPVRDVEDDLMLHPDVRDVAIVGAPPATSGATGDEVWAVVVAGDREPTLDELREHLAWRGMTTAYYPTRLRIVDTLPRDQMGKIRKYQLRDALVTA